MAFTVTERRGGSTGLPPAGRPAAVRLEQRRQRFGVVFFVALVIALGTSVAVGLGLSGADAPDVVAAQGAAPPQGQGMSPVPVGGGVLADRLGIAGRAGVDTAGQAGVDRAGATRSDAVPPGRATGTSALSAPAPSASFDGLRLGVTSPDVRVWQAQMHARGWPLHVDGVFGERSDAVARAFQREKGLRVDGVVGVESWTAAWTSPVT